MVTDSSNNLRPLPLRASLPDRLEDRPIKKKSKRPAPISVRVSEEERAELTRRAGSLSLSAFVRRMVFGEDAARRSARAVSVDRVLLAQVLAALGSSRLTEQVGILARAAEAGNLYVDDRIKGLIQRACDDLRIVRQAVLMALGKRPPDEPDQDVQSGFNGAASGEEDSQ